MLFELFKLLFLKTTHKKIKKIRGQLTPKLLSINSLVPPTQIIK